ncbi:hypothetical protein AB205_0060870, partial [Aquarana catesbeiana]
MDCDRYLGTQMDCEKYSGTQMDCDRSGMGCVRGTHLIPNRRAVARSRERHMTPAQDGKSHLWMS